MKIIFLDVDGVLNRLGSTPDERTVERSKHGFIGIEQRLCAIIRRIVQETGSRIVLSSSWRDGGGESTREVSEALQLDLYSETPSGFDGFRGAQILSWLTSMHKQEDEYRRQSNLDGRIEKYAIIDDDGDMFAFQPLFQTDYRMGVTDELADKIIKYLNS